jgi:hypothetical protein
MPTIAEAVRLGSPTYQPEIAKNWHNSPFFFRNEDENSLQPRLRGGARSLALTFLRPNSLLTGKFAGKFRFFALGFALLSLQTTHSAGEDLHSPQIGTGN